jgi:hypothetical protein
MTTGTSWTTRTEPPLVLQADALRQHVAAWYDRAGRSDAANGLDDGVAILIGLAAHHRRGSRRDLDHC